MPRYPEVPCAGLCGRKIWAGTGSLPPGEAMCRECRRVRRESNVPDIDTDALRRLTVYLHDAIAAQPPHVADQLDAALREGRTSLRLEQSVVAPVVIVSVNGHDLAEVDVRNLLDGAVE